MSSDQILPSRTRPARRANLTFLSPVVRRLARQHDIDVREMHGTGAGGRITRADLLDAHDRVAPGNAQQDAAAYEVLPLSPIRRRTAEHLVRSKATSAHAFCAIESDLEGVEIIRRELGPHWRQREGFTLTYLPFIVHAVGNALRAFPHLNATVQDQHLNTHPRVNVGIAVDRDHQGLVVPVLHDADRLSLAALARRIADLGARARSGQLRPDDIADGTFTITNPGAAGTFLSVPIIHQPQVAILATDGVQRRVMAVELPDGTDAIAVHATANLGLSFDQRVIDPLYASAFLGHVAQDLQSTGSQQLLHSVPDPGGACSSVASGPRDAPR